MRACLYWSLTLWYAACDRVTAAIYFRHVTLVILRLCAILCTDYLP